MPIRTTKANYEQMKEGILISELPKTFRDAIKIAKSLYVRYLWIDSLCIIQDSEEDWAAEAEKMGGVYRKATFTIAAHGSADSSGGCFVAGASRQNGFSTIQGMNKEGVKSDIHIRLSGFREPSRDEGLAHIAKGNKTKLLPSRLSTRGWVFQERLLSQRTLHYTGSELVFECRAGLQCECRVGLDTSEHATNFKRKFMEETADAKVESLRYGLRSRSHRFKYRLLNNQKIAFQMSSLDGSSSWSTTPNCNLQNNLIGYQHSPASLVPTGRISTMHPRQALQLISLDFGRRAFTEICTGEARNSGLLVPLPFIAATKRSTRQVGRGLRSQDPSSTRKK